MPILSQAQVEMYARSAGMPNPQLMAAIAMAESSGDTRAHNPLGLDNSYGLWQINMLGDMGPARRRQFGISRNEELFDPAVNARAAAMILSGQGLKAWSTYTNGAYKKYMGKGGSAGTATPAWDPFDPFGILPDGSTDPLYEVPGLGEAADIAKGVGAIGEGVVKAGMWIAQPANWVRVAYVIGGGVLVGVGLYIVASPLVGKAAMSSPVGQVVKKAIPSRGGGKKARAKESSG